MSLRLLAAMLAVACGCASTPAVPATALAPAAPPPGEAGPVSLRFAWPAALRATVVSVKERRVAGAPPVHREISYSLEARRAGDDLVVFERADGIGEEPLAASAPLDQQLLWAGSRVGLVIGPDAAVKRFEGLEAVTALLRQAAAKMPAPAQKAFLGLIDGGLLTTAATNDWTETVAFWNGADVELGRWYDLGPEQLGEGRSMRFAALERTACGDAEGGCVKLQAVSKLPEAEVRALLGPLLQAVQGQRVELGSMSFEPVLTVVAEPGTLLPHRYEKRTRMRMELVVDGEPATLEGEELRTRTYRYDR